MADRETHLLKITKFLSVFKYEIELRNSISLYDINIHAEYFYRDFLKLVYGYDLRNANEAEKNYPYVDLFGSYEDKDGKKHDIAIQVTSQNGNGKIAKTIKGFYKDDDNKKSELKVLLIANDAKKYTTDFTENGKFTFNHKDDVIDIKRLLAKIQTKTTEELKSIWKLLEKDVIKFVSDSQTPPTVPKIISTNNLNVPKHFTGRVNVLDDIAATLQTRKSAALCGIKGLGKTSVVYKYIEQHAEIYRHIIFIRSDRSGFTINLDKVCAEMFLVFGETDSDEARAKKFSDKIQELCANVENDKFVLLIFDNVDEVVQVAKFVPQFERLHVLLTSNFALIHQVGYRVPIDNLSDVEAKLLLFQLVNPQGVTSLDNLAVEEQAAMLQIAELLGHHPFALTIAGLYIRENGKSFVRYLNSLRQSTGKILKDESGADAYQHPSIYTAFEIPFDEIYRVADDSNEAKTVAEITRECLKIASLMSPENMPEEVFTESATKLFPAHSGFIADEDNWDKVYRKLSHYGFFERLSAASTFSVHRLFRLFLIDKLKNEVEPVLETLAEVLKGKFKNFNFANKIIVEQYLPHVGTFLKYLGANKLQEQANLKLENKSTANLCNNYAKYFELYGQYEKAEKYYVYFKDICESVEKIDQTWTATSYNNLAGLYETQGRYAEAEPLYLKALAISKKELGENHPLTAISYNNLAGLYKLQGRYAEAEPLYLKALAIREKELGENHLDTVTTYNDLGNLYNNVGKYVESETYLKKTIVVYENILGLEHPWMATSYNNLAGLYETQGRYAEAEPLYLKALAIREKELGENHPSTATSYNNLGVLCFNQSKYAEAKVWLTKALIVRKTVLGNNHPYTIQTRQSLEYVEEMLSESEN
jgi:tetratricopeptide (TPR) repeat protein